MTAFLARQPYGHNVAGYWICRIIERALKGN